MLRTLSIRNFRCFDQFEMRDLGRVNLLVGTNNSGKTSVLEAIEILCSTGDIQPIRLAALRRGELLNDKEPEVAIRHLFRGHSIAPSSKLTISARSDGRDESFLAEVRERHGETASAAAFATKAAISSNAPREERNATSELALQEEPGSASAPIEPWESDLDLVLSWTGTAEAEFILHLTDKGGIGSRSGRGYRRGIDDRARNVHYITTASLSASEAVWLFERIVLTREESLVVDALRIIDPTIERIAATSVAQAQLFDVAGQRGGILVRCGGVEQRIPIGSLGDGTWRMLGLALALARTENGVLLVDEIDTGLHYTVMVDMWKMVAETAQRLNVQVFATTHSRDCYESLAAIAHEGVAEGSEVTIQRIEREKGRAVAYSEQEIVAAAEHGVEVR